MSAGGSAWTTVGSDQFALGSSEVDPDNAVELVAEATDDGYIRDVKFYEEPSSIFEIRSRR